MMYGYIRKTGQRVMLVTEYTNSYKVVVVGTLATIFVSVGQIDWK